MEVKAGRGALIDPEKTKMQTNVMLDGDLVIWLQQAAADEGINYQDYLNEVLRGAKTLGAKTASLYETLEFYGDPDTYRAIGFLPDPPCGEFVDDWDDTRKPGRRAREALAKFNE